MLQNTLNFIAKVLGNEAKNLFFIRLGTTLTLNYFGITGIAAQFIGFFMRGLLGVLYEGGVFSIDVFIDAYKEGAKLDEFKVEALKAYNEATRKVHSEAEKEKIRADYQRIIDRIGSVGNGSKSN